MSHIHVTDGWRNVLALLGGWRERCGFVWVTKHLNAGGLDCDHRPETGRHDCRGWGIAD